MNTVIKILFFTLIILLFSCKKEPVYHDIPENIRQALLYYYNPDSDTIMFLKNNVDTLLFVYIIKNIFYNKPCPSCDYLEEYYGGLLGIYNDYHIFISATVNSHIAHSYDIQIYRSNPSFSLEVNNIVHNYTSLNVNGQIYYDVYLFNLITNQNDIIRVDSIYTSSENGIIKAWNDTISFSLID